MSSLRSFTASTARPLPVIILADVSGSMSVDGKIDALNVALSELLRSFTQEDSGRAEVQVAVITFGGEVSCHLPLTPARRATLAPFAASGSTPMGAAFVQARSLIEDKEQISGRAYTPAIVLVSDGMPTDNWQPSLANLLGESRASKAQRFALGIGADADPSVLKAFLNDPEAKVYAAHEAGEIKTFFRWVTLSVAARSRSANPNDTNGIPLPPVDLDELL